MSYTQRCRYIFTYSCLIESKMGKFNSNNLNFEEHILRVTYIKLSFDALGVDFFELFDGKSLRILLNLLLKLRWID